MIRLKKLRRRLLLQYLLTVGLLLGGSEVSLYCVSRWAGETELDTALEKDIEKLAGAIEFERDGGVEIEGEHQWDGMRLHGRITGWQVLTLDGSTVGRSRSILARGEDLPAVGGSALPVGEMRIADAPYGGSNAVRAARLLVVRKRPAWAAPAADAPQTVVFDIRTVVDRSRLDEQLQDLAWYLAGGFPILLALAAMGGHWLINRAVRPVEEAFLRERRFTGAASHELRTPLTALRGEIDVTLRHPRSAGEYVQAIRRMDGLVGRMTGLVEGLLVLARADAGHLLSDVSEMSAAELLAAVCEVIDPLPGRERVTITRTASENVKILGDGLLLAIAVRNLVENSLSYAPDGPVELRIATSPDDQLELVVEDRGPGVPAEVLAAFEEKGSSGRIPARSNAGKAGLGLSITRAVVESHGGEFRLENLPESGCKATVRLPAAAEG